MSKVEKLLKDMQGNEWYKHFDEALAFCMEKDLDGDFDFGIIDYDTAEEMARNELEKGGLLRLRFFLNDVSLTDDYFRLDGYGNLAEIKQDDVVFWLGEIIDSEK